MVQLLESSGAKTIIMIEFSGCVFDSLSSVTKIYDSVMFYMYSYLNKGVLLLI